MQVTLRYFASLREALGPGGPFELPDGETVGHLRDRLVALGGRHAEVLARSRALRCAIDRTMCDEAEAVAPGSEVAFFPPVTGG